MAKNGAVHPVPKAVLNLKELNPVPNAELNMKEVNPVPKAELNLKEVNPVPNAELNLNELNPVPKEVKNLDVQSKYLKLSQEVLKLKLLKQKVQEVLPVTSPLWKLAKQANNPKNPELLKPLLHKLKVPLKLFA